jgi:hypothetical protein
MLACASAQLGQRNMLPGNVGSASPDPAADAAGGGRSPTDRGTARDLLAAHALLPRKPQDRSHYDVRAALRQRTARRDLLVKLSLISAAFGAVACAVYKWLG